MRPLILAALFGLFITSPAGAGESSITDGLIDGPKLLGELDRHFVEVLNSPENDTIDPDAAWMVEELTVDLDGLTVTFTGGEFFPRVAVDGQVFGAVYLGEGRWQFDPPPGLEQGELARLTRQESIDTTFEDALLRFSPDYLERFQEGALPASGDAKQARKAKRYWSKRAQEQDRVLGDHDLLVARYLIEGMEHLDSLRIDAQLKAVKSDKDEARVEGAARYVYVWDHEDPEEVSLTRYVVNPADSRVRSREILCHFPRKQDREQLTRRQLAYKDPTLLDVTHYDCKFKFAENPNSGETELKGDVTVTFHPVFRDVKVAAFSLLGGREGPDSWHQLWLTVRAVADVEGNPLPFVHSSGEVTVELPEPARVGEPMTIRFLYGGKVLMGSDYTLLNTYDWYPRNPQQTFDRFTWHWVFNVPKVWQLVASGTITEEPAGKEIVYDVTGEVPSCWASVILGPYLMIEDEEDDERRPHIRVFSEPADLDGAKEIREYAHGIIEFYEELFGVPFVYDELDIAQMPVGIGFAQALPGMIQMDGAAFKSKTELVTVYQVNDPTIREFFLPHEIAHQWFAHDVGTRTTHDYWMMETFCEYSSALFREAAFGAAGYNRYLAHWHKERDGANTKRTTSLWMSATGRDSRRYVATAYARGPLIMHQLRVQFGAEKVINILRAILQEYSGKTMTTEDFQMVLESATGMDFDEFFEAFIYGNAPMDSAPEDRNQ